MEQQEINERNTQAEKERINAIPILTNEEIGNALDEDECDMEYINEHPEEFVRYTVEPDILPRLKSVGFLI